jgi:hypothetical protein
MRTSPCWTHIRHDLSHVGLRLRLSYHVHLGFSLHLCTVSAITPSYDVETRRISTRWKEDDDAVDLVLVLAPEVARIILCDLDKVLRHLFWANFAVYQVGPLAQVVGAPLLVSHNPRTTLPLHELSSHRRFRRGFCLEFSVVEQSPLSVCETPTFVC